MTASNKSELPNQNADYKIIEVEYGFASVIAHVNILIIDHCANFNQIMYVVPVKLQRSLPSHPTEDNVGVKSVKL